MSKFEKLKIETGVFINGGLKIRNSNPEASGRNPK
jgi:hypothetical protein